MIRPLAFCMLAALPAQALDFRGLLPGRPASDLARLGEPFELQTRDGVTAASYPLPFEHQLDVIYAQGTILELTLGGPATSGLRLPATDGLQMGDTQLHEVLALAGSDGFAFDVHQVLPDLPPTGWEVFYTVRDHPDLILSLTFYGPAPGMAPEDISGVQQMPQDAVLIAANLREAGAFARIPLLAELEHAPPPEDAIPFGLPLSDAFPLIEIPQ